MELFSKWVVKLGLALLAVVVLAVAVIIMDLNETGEELFKTNVPGRMGERQVVHFNLEESERVHVLVLSPDIESGWGEPDVYLEALLTDPEGRELVRVTRDELFGGYDDGSTRNYTEKYEFMAGESGEYTLEITVLTEHVEAVYITIGRRTAK